MYLHACKWIQYWSGCCKFTLPDLSLRHIHWPPEHLLDSRFQLPECNQFLALIQHRCYSINAAEDLGKTTVAEGQCEDRRSRKCKWWEELICRWLGGSRLWTCTHFLRTAEDVLLRTTKKISFRWKASNFGYNFLCYFHKTMKHSRERTALLKHCNNSELFTKVYQNL